LFVLTNTLDHEMVVRVERMAPREDALTAARASAMPAFRELFPQEVLGPGQLISVAGVTLLVAEIEGGDQWLAELGDARAFERVLRTFRIMGDQIVAESGAVVKTVGHGVVAAFDRPLSAVRAALSLQSKLAQDPTTASVVLRVGVHTGTAMAATVNDRLDYYGVMVVVAMQLPSHCSGSI
jgi:class 3 adenylate cyclase